MVIKATVITDASFCPNINRGGYGAWIKGDGIVIRTGGVLKGNVDNSSRAEMLAALNGIWLAYNAGARQILLQTDSKEVVDVISLGCGKKLRELFEKARELHFPLARIAAKHVKGHTDVQDARSWVNRWCDAEARKHMLAARAENEKALRAKQPEFRSNKGVREAV